MVTEMRAQGQVTQRLLVLCGLNTVYSVVCFYLIMGQRGDAEDEDTGG